jgi:hypothetical protein
LWHFTVALAVVAAMQHHLLAGSGEAVTKL